MAKPFPKLDSRVVLAPMHGVTNIAFRLMCKKYGAGLVSTELLSANALARKNKVTLELAKTYEEEKPSVAQIFSNNTDNFVKSAQLLERDFDMININFGCPSDKIEKQGCGGYLLKRKNKIAEIVKKVSESIEKPLTVKIRSGIDKDSINAVEIAKICEECGASAIIIHARTVKQGYSGKADWSIIKKIKEKIRIPVIGNGDVTDGESCRRMFDETGCDYVMIGRAAIGNPFIFKEVNEYLKTGKIIEQSKEEKIKDFFEYIELAKKYDVFSIKDAKLKAGEFTKGFPGSARLREKLNRVKTWEEIERLIRDTTNFK